MTRMLARLFARHTLLDKNEGAAQEREDKAWEEFRNDYEPDSELSDEENEKAMVDLFNEEYQYDPTPSDEEIGNAAPPFWNKVVRDLGYVGVVDSQGQGIIHGNEKTQAVFFSKRDIRVLELIDNITPSEPYDDIAVWTMQPKALLRLIQKGKITDEKLIAVLKDNRNFIMGVGFSNLPPLVQSYIRDNALVFLGGYGTSEPEDFGLDDEQMIKVLKATPGWAATLKKPSLGIKKYIIDHLNDVECFRDHFDKLPFTDEEKLQVMQKYPNLIRYEHNPSPVLQKWILANHPERFSQCLWRDTITPESYITYFNWLRVTKSKIPGGWRREPTLYEFLNLLLRNGEPDPTFKVFLLCFARLSSPSAVKYARENLNRTHNAYLLQQVCKLKPACKAVFEKMGIKLD